MFAYVLNHSYTFFQNNFAGSITKKLADMAINVEPLISIPNQWFYPRVISSVIASATLFTVVHPLFGIILFVWALVFVYLSYIAAKGSERYARSFAESISKMDGTISDTISNVMSTKLFDNISHQISHVSKNITHVVKKDRALQWYNLKVNFIQGIGVTVLMVSMLAAPSLRSSIIYFLSRYLNPSITKIYKFVFNSCFLFYKCPFNGLNLPRLAYI